VLQDKISPPLRNSWVTQFGDWSFDCTILPLLSLSAYSP